MKTYTYTKQRCFSDGLGLSIQSAPVKRDEPPHTHEFIEMVYILGGSGIHGIDGREYAVSHGSLLFINYRQIHYLRSEHQMEICNILLDPEWISEKLLDSENAFELLTLSSFSYFQKEVNTDMAMIRFDANERKTVERMIEQMKEEQRNKLAGYDTVLKSLVNIFLTMVFRKMSNESVQSTWKMTPEFLEYIRAHCAEKLSLQTLAKECFYNPAYFSRLFKEHYGFTVSDFISQSRLDKAMQMLKDSSLSAEEIAYSAGFSSKGAFYKLLKDKTGCTPAEYRKKVKNQHDSL